MADCAFCGIVQGAIPSEKIYEDSNILAFLDINPRSRGHSIIIPKQHFSTLADLPSEQINNLFGVAKQVGISAIKNLGAQGFNIGSNNGAVAGQIVPHLHVHVIPRYDEGADKRYGFEAAFPVKEELKAQLKAVAGQMKVEAPPVQKEAPKEEAKGEGKEEKKNWKFLKFDEKPDFFEE